MIKFIIYVFWWMLFWSCAHDQEEIEQSVNHDSVVLISRYAPGPYNHYLSEDTVGQINLNKTGPYAPISSPRFTYLDDRQVVRDWVPEIDFVDTIAIRCVDQYLEVKVDNYFTLMPTTFLFKAGDTVVIDYPGKLPSVKILNRAIEDVALNYNNYRLSRLFNNSLSTHRKVRLGVLLDHDLSYDETVIKYYKKSLDAITEENHWLDSLVSEGLISEDDFRYRIDNLNELRKQHLKNRMIKKYVEDQEQESLERHLPVIDTFEFSKVDSLMKFAFFRNRLDRISQYNLPLIFNFNGNAGSAFIDARIRFDSICMDSRFTQAARDFLLVGAYQQILANFPIEDRNIYWSRMNNMIHDRELLRDLENKYNLDFGDSNKLVLTSLSADSLTFQDLLQKYRGQWLYIDFWGSWCQPCLRQIPSSRKLYRELQENNIEFIFLALNDKRDQWLHVIASDSLNFGRHYLVENSSTSTVLETLSISTLPHYLVYNPDGQLIDSNAPRPDAGAKSKLEEYMRHQ
ncbi:MAG: TlpA family protein disulfide reductase [Saprospiraceae bacterium]|nr:TlpA family protein disulfide reductase [Saprospiraceae bacterium]